MTNVGEVIGGKYQVVRKMGAGGMSRVWLAEDLFRGKLRAIKETDKNVPGDAHAAYIDRLRAEAEFMMGEFAHPALPRVVDIVEDDSSLFVVMDFVEGEDLLTAMNKNRLPMAEEDVIDYGMQLCGVLSYLHAKGIIHRNVQPRNVMVQVDGQIRLFGCYIDQGPEDQSCDVAPFGMGGGYAPPGMHGRNSQLMPEYDVYSLGATLFHLATGRGSAEFANSAALPPLRSVNPGLSEGFEIVVATATQLNPAKRYRSCRGFAQELHKASIANAAGRAAREQTTGYKVFHYSYSEGASPLWRRQYEIFRNGDACMLRVIGGFEPESSAVVPAKKVEKMIVRPLSRLRWKGEYKLDCPMCDGYVWRIDLSWDGVELHSSGYAATPRNYREATSKFEVRFAELLRSGMT